MTGSSDCYSLRRLCPFLGTIQVVKTAKARGYTTDGSTWQIQVRADRPSTLWGSLNRDSVTEYYRFGVWSSGQGLGRVPLNPLLDAGAMIEATDELVIQLARQQGELPFPPRDDHELWLLDKQERLPLALLASSINEEELQRIQRAAWVAARHDDRGFLSPTLSRQGIPKQTSSGGNRHQDVLEQTIRNAGGETQWFRRAPDGTGAGLPYNAPVDLIGRTLPPARFPELLIRETWEQSQDLSLIADYISWLAARLLTLPGLTPSTRARLEPMACRQAMVVDSLWSLYPAIIDPASLAQARVEARIRKANATATQ